MTPDESLKAMTCSLRAGQAMLESSVSVSDVTEAMLRMTRAFGLDRCEVSITLNTITMCNLPSPAAEPVTMVKVVDVGEPRLDRLAAVEELVRGTESGEIGIESAFRRIQEIEQSEVPYPRWTPFVAGLVSVAAWVVFAGGGAIAATAGVLGSLVVQPVVRRLNRRRLPEVVGTFVAGGIVVLVPYLILATGLEIALVPAIIGGLYPLLPGGALVASVTDGLSGAPISGLAKGLQALVVALVLGLGVAAAQEVVGRLEITGDTTEVTIPAVGVMVAAGIAVAALAIARGMPLTAVWPTTLVAVVAWVVPHVAPDRGLGANAATFLGAAVIGLGGQLFARLQHLPGTVYTTSAVYVLVPGTAIYLAMSSFAAGADQAGAEALFSALRTATAIAGGVAVGVALGRSVPAPSARVTLFRRHRPERRR